MRNVTIGRTFPLLTVLTIGLAAAPVRADDGPLGMTCSTVTSLDGVTYRKCTGKIRTFDGIGLDVDLSLPTGSSEPLPTILMLHGWGGDKTVWEASTKDLDGRAGYHWNNVWFVSKGYAVVNPTARGFAGSCGLTDGDPACVNGYTHAADRDFENRDNEAILGALVDAGVSDPSRLASTGGSYGGGRSWLLATSLPWTTPKGTTLQLAAAVPFYGWTDLVNGIMPNGRATDSVDQSASHEGPLGVLKESWIDLLYTGAYEAYVRYNETDTKDAGSAITLDFAAWQLGEPYEQDPLIPPFIAAFRKKSAYYADDYFAAIGSGATREVPVFAVQGWNDTILTPVELLQMYRKLKAADPRYPITMAFGDVGHLNTQDVPEQWQAINAEANAFLDRVFAGEGPGEDRVLAFRTRCSGGIDPEDEPLVSTDWDHAARGAVVATSSSSRVTTFAPTDAVDGAANEPLVLGLAVHRGCLDEPDPPSTTTWKWAVPAPGFTLLGLPEVEIAYSLTGEPDATPIFRLWDLSPGANRVLVTRGVWRITAATDEPATGFIKTKLFGNAWRFDPGHEIELEVSQTDVPYFRPDNLASSLTFMGPRVTLPVREILSQKLDAP